MECALIQMKTKTLPKIAEALAGLDHGTFGSTQRTRRAASRTPWRSLPGPHGPGRVTQI